ncbi:MAG: metal ABC transporter ATP-binding protein [Candidatus Staskawiczbacteria bacterium]|nr:metal ABC transporter ATP-binding protein [Candidatus Staskawiczbacteria bacterium]
MENNSYIQKNLKTSNRVDHSKNIIEVNNVSFNYGDEEVLKDITLNIHMGDYLGIVGPNGAGKTTLLKIILGLLNPSHGSIKLFGQDVKKFKDWSRVGYVPQKATNFDVNFPATVREVVAMARFAKRGLFRFATKEDDAIIEISLKHVDMWGYKDRLIGDLSSGQQQRIFIARALAGQPEIIFLDEPTTGVDQNAQNEFYNLLRKLNKELNLTLVLVTHDIDRIIKEAMHIACVDRILVCHTSSEEFIKQSEFLNISGQNIKVITHHHNH